MMVVSVTVVSELAVQVMAMAVMAVFGSICEFFYLYGHVNINKLFLENE